MSQKITSTELGKSIPSLAVLTEAYKKLACQAFTAKDGIESMREIEIALAKQNVNIEYGTRPIPKPHNRPKFVQNKRVTNFSRNR